MVFILMLIGFWDCVSFAVKYKKGISHREGK